jgi:hypothetical protein
MAESWWLDIPAVVAAVAVAAVPTRAGTGVDLLGRLDLATRRGAYTDLLTLISIFAASIAIAFVAYLGMSSEGVNRVRRVVGTKILRVWVSAFVLPWGAALAVFVVKLTDRGGVESTNPARWFAVGAMLLVVIQLGRAAWVFCLLASTDLQPWAPTLATSPTSVRVKTPAPTH